MMPDLAYLFMLCGLVSCTIQDLRTHTVNLFSLGAWVIGSLLYAIDTGVGYAFYPTLAVGLILRNCMAPADLVAICASSMWFGIDKVPLFWSSIGCCSLFLHWFHRSKKAPMMPAIAMSWFVAHFTGECVFCACFLAARFASLFESLFFRMRSFCEGFL